MQGAALVLRNRSSSSLAGGSSGPFSKIRRIIQINVTTTQKEMKDL